MDATLSSVISEMDFEKLAEFSMQQAVRLALHMPGDGKTLQDTDEYGTIVNEDNVVVACKELRQIAAECRAWKHGPPKPPQPIKIPDQLTLNISLSEADR